MCEFNTDTQHSDCRNFGHHWGKILNASNLKEETSILAHSLEVSAHAWLAGSKEKQMAEGLEKGYSPHGGQ